MASNEMSIERGVLAILLDETIGSRRVSLLLVSVECHDQTPMRLELTKRK